jgi:PAS domain S-box-containing protein
MKTKNFTEEAPLTLLLEQALRSLPHGVAILDRTYHIAYINTAGQTIFFQHLGKAPSAGDSMLDFALNPERASIAKEAIDRAFSNIRNNYLLYYPQNGVDTWLELDYVPLLDNGQVSHVYLTVKDMTEKVELEQKLEKQRKAEKDKIIKASLEAQDKERHQIGRELHDNVNQVLTTVKLYNEICYVEDVPNREMLRKSVEQINYCIGELRKISKQLSPPGIDEISLKELIRDLINSINVTNKIDVQLFTFGIREEKLNEKIQTSIYRITQEQLTNVLKYAYASSVEVFLVQTSENIALKIQDNGVGFDMASKRKGIGITNMINRAETLGGKIDFNTAPGQGCTLMAEIPLAIGDD